MKVCVYSKAVFLLLLVGPDVSLTHIKLTSGGVNIGKPSSGEVFPLLWRGLPVIASPDDGFPISPFPDARLGVRNRSSGHPIMGNRSSGRVNIGKGIIGGINIGNGSIGAD